MNLCQRGDIRLIRTIKVLLNKKYIGIVLTFIFYIAFCMTTNLYRNKVEGTVWFISNSLQRFIFGLIELMLFIKFFHKRNWKEVLYFKGYRNSLLAGSGIILFTIYLIIYLISGTAEFIGLTIPIIISQLVCQQISTGFFEEITFRGFVLEGYFYQNRQTVSMRLTYALISFLIFGSAHLTGCNSWPDAVYRVVTTGIIGLAFTAIYLYSHNLLLAMLLHTIFDIPSNLINYVGWSNTVVKVFLDNIFYGMYIIVGVVSLIFIIKASNNPDCNNSVTVR